MTDEHVAKIPAANLRQPRNVFGIVWRKFEELDDDPELLTGYLVGVGLTLRWLAGQPFPDLYADGAGLQWPVSPIRHLQIPVTAEVVADEYVAAAKVAGEGGPTYEVARGAAQALLWAYYGGNDLPFNWREAG